MLAGYSIFQQKRYLPARKHQRIFISFLTLILLVSVGKNHKKIIRNHHNERIQHVELITNAVERHSTTSQPIFVWGAMADIYFHTQNQPASHYTLVYPLLAPGFVDDSKINILLDELRASHAELIVDVSSKNRNIPSLDEWNGKFNAYGTTIHPSLKRYYDYVHQNFEKVETVGEWQWNVWKRKAPTSS